MCSFVHTDSEHASDNSCTIDEHDLTALLRHTTSHTAAAPFRCSIATPTREVLELPCNIYVKISNTWAIVRDANGDGTGYLPTSEGSLYKNLATINPHCFLVLLVSGNPSMRIQRKQRSLDVPAPKRTSQDAWNSLLEWLSSLARSDDATWTRVTAILPDVPSVADGEKLVQSFSNYLTWGMEACELEDYFDQEHPCDEFRGEPHVNFGNCCPAITIRLSIR